MNLIRAFSAIDFIAFVWFVCAWVIYVWYARQRSLRRDSLLTATNRMRYEWLIQTTTRDPRVLDGIITQTLAGTPSFFCNTTILVIGGLLAVLGTGEKAMELVQDLPFAAQTSAAVLETKLALLLVVFVFAFFRFSWSMRLYTFVALAIGSMPDHMQYMQNETLVESTAQRIARLVAAAAEAFNDGLRSYYFAFALVSWIFSGTAFVIATSIVVIVLYRREFKSELLQILR